jgi:type IV secretion system protein VirD4
MIIKGTLSGTIAAPATLMAELAIFSLAQNKWERGTYNLRDEIVTKKKHSEKVSGIGYEIQYDVCLRWQALAAQSPTNQSTKVTVEVTEPRGNATARDCQQECYNIIDGINRRAGGLVKAYKEAPPHTKHGDARWSTDDDLARADYLVNNFDDSRFLLGPHTKAKYLAVTEKETLRHTIICGPTGCGKSSTIFVPNLVNRSNWSALVTEAVAMNENPHLLERTAGYRQQRGHKIYYFNPNDLRSCRINPVDSVKNISDAVRLSNLIITNTKTHVSSTADPFWERNETALLTSLIMHAAMDHGHLGSIRELIRHGPEQLSAVLSASPSQEARARFDEFMLWTNKTETTRNSIVIGLVQRLELWTQPRIVALTETTDVDFESLKNELFTFYLAVPGDVQELKPCAALIFSYLLQFIIGNKFKHRVALFLDEFPNFGLLPDFPAKLSLSLRHNDLPAVLGLQDYVQAEILYKESASLLFSQPAARVYFRPQQLPQAEIISKSLGKETVYERRVDSECRIVEDEVGRDLMTPGSVQALDDKHAIVFTARTPPIKMRLFDVSDHDWATKIPLPPFRLLQVDEKLVRACATAAQPTPFQQETNTYNPYGDRMPSI